MRYISKREQVMKFFDEVVIPIIKIYDVNEQKLIAWIISKTAGSEKLVKEVIQNALIMKKIERCPLGGLTIVEGDIVDFLKETRPVRIEEEVVNKILEVENANAG